MFACLAGLVTLLTLYQFAAPSEWPRLPDLFASPRVVVSDVTVLQRTPVDDAVQYETDHLSLSVTGDKVESAWPLRDKNLYVLYAFGEDDYATWHVGRSTGNLALPASLEGKECATDNWELQAQAVCPADYRGVVALVAVLAPVGAFRHSHMLVHGNIDSWHLPAASHVGNVHFLSLAAVAEDDSPYRQVAALSAGVSLSRFRKALGPEAYHTNHSWGREYTFVHPEYYVQAVTWRSDDRVKFYVVTTRSAKFKPVFNFSFVGSPRTVQLGQTRFADLDHGYQPDLAYSYIFANRLLYYDIWYCANPGHYQSAIIADSDAVYLQMDWWSPMLRTGPRIRDFDDKDVATYRRNAVIDTFGMTAPGVMPAFFCKTVGGWPRIWIGVDVMEAQAADSSQ